MAEYLPRITDSILRNELDSVGAVLLEGPKWCGKTSFKMVVSGLSSYAYRRPDDVYVVPIGCL